MLKILLLFTITAYATEAASDPRPVNGEWRNATLMADIQLARHETEARANFVRAVTAWEKDLFKTRQLSAHAPGAVKRHSSRRMRAGSIVAAW